MINYPMTYTLYYFSYGTKLDDEMKRFHVRQK